MNYADNSVSRLEPRGMDLGVTPQWVYSQWHSLPSRVDSLSTGGDIVHGYLHFWLADSFF